MKPAITMGFLISRINAQIMENALCHLAKCAISVISSVTIAGNVLMDIRCCKTNAL